MGTYLTTLFSYVLLLDSVGLLSIVTDVNVEAHLPRKGRRARKQCAGPDLARGPGKLVQVVGFHSDLKEQRDLTCPELGTAFWVEGNVFGGPGGCWRWRKNGVLGEPKALGAADAWTSWDTMVQMTVMA
jgi:hypothetical protein